MNQMSAKIDIDSVLHDGERFCDPVVFHSDATSAHWKMMWIALKQEHSDAAEKDNRIRLLELGMGVIRAKARLVIDREIDNSAESLATWVAKQVSVFLPENPAAPSGSGGAGQDGSPEG